MDEKTARDAFENALATYQAGFGTFFIAKLFGLDISYLDEKCVIRFPVRDFLFNPQGSLHGGIIGTIMDISMGHLLQKGTGVGGATLEMKLQFLRPVSSGTARCEAAFLRKGRSVAFLESRLFDADGKLAAVASSTWKPGSQQ